MKKQYTPQEVANILGVSKQTIHNWIGSKKIDHKEIKLVPILHPFISAKEMKRLVKDKLSILGKRLY